MEILSSGQSGAAFFIISSTALHFFNTSSTKENTKTLSSNPGANSLRFLFRTSFIFLSVQVLFCPEVEIKSHSKSVWSTIDLERCRLAIIDFQ